jgi:hypothetical protein
VRYGFLRGGSLGFMNGGAGGVGVMLGMGKSWWLTAVFLLAAVAGILGLAILDRWEREDRNLL